MNEDTNTEVVSHLVSKKLRINNVIDKLLEGGLEAGAITNVYGPPGSGKTNLILIASLQCAKSGKKTIFIDTEGSFSLERFMQLGGNEEELRKILFLDVYDWGEQCSKINELENAIGDEIGLVVVDSMVALYRIAMDDSNFQKTNKQLSTQYSRLSAIARKRGIPVLVTNQVYSLADEKTEMTSRTIGKYWSKTLMEIKKLEKDGQRLIVLRKHRSVPEGKKVEFEITHEGMKETGRFGLF